MRSSQTRVRSSVTAGQSEERERKRKTRPTDLPATLQPPSEEDRLDLQWINEWTAALEDFWCLAPAVERRREKLRLLSRDKSKREQKEKIADHEGKNVSLKERAKKGG